MKTVLTLHLLSAAMAAASADGTRGGLRRLPGKDKSKGKRSEKHAARKKAKEGRGKRAKDFDLREEVAAIAHPMQAPPAPAPPVPVPAIAEAVGWVPTPSPTTANPTVPPTPAPTPAPSPEPSPASSEDALATPAPSVDALAAVASASDPPCPAAYDPTFSAYIAGDEVAMDTHIFVCLGGDYTQYCNIVQKDETWSQEVQDRWSDAWSYVGPCVDVMIDATETVEDVVIAPPMPEPASTEAPGTTAATTGATDDSTAFPTVTPPEPTASPSVDVLTASPTVDALAAVTICPLRYNPTTLTTYVSGDQVEVNEQIFECREGEGYATFCNVAEKDPLWTEAEVMMWNEAWEYVGACQPGTLESLLEDEALGGR
ncbi:hypothetical protein ACHAXT_011655 [Thalassiosira profunda]